MSGVPNSSNPKPPSFWEEVRNIYFYSLTHATILPAMALLILLLVLNVIGGGFGAFAVIWKDVPAQRNYGIFDIAIFWNGFAIALFFLVLAYLIYLLYARDNADETISDRRSHFVFILAVPPTLIANLPAAFPDWFGQDRDSKRDRMFVYGTLTAFAVVSALLLGGMSALWTLRRTNRYAVARAAAEPAGRFRSMEKAGARVGKLYKWAILKKLRGQSRVESQADLLFRTVLGGYFGLVGFSLHDDLNPSPQWLPFAALAVCAAALWYRIRVRALSEYAKNYPQPPTPEPRESIGYALASYLTAGACYVLVGLSGGFAIAAIFQTIMGSEEIRVVPAAQSFCFLLAAIASLYGLLRFYAGRWFYPACIAATAAALAVATVRPYSHRIEELATYYESGKRVELADYNRMRDVDNGQLDNGLVLEGWRKWVCEKHGIPKDRRPPLVIVTTAGGASVSAIYTYRILARLEEEMPGFHRHVRIITGASGGMFGASAFRARLRDGALPDDVRRWQAGLEADFFSPAVQSFAFKDIPMNAACYRGYSNDRGRRLEMSWESAFPENWKVDFKMLTSEEQDGKLPSLIFSPMMVEDGRPLLISTLDLELMTRGNAYIKTIEKDYGKLETTTDPAPAVEFFKLFPESTNLRLGTAARLSASFPYLSPAATLPTSPPRRLVDAGYLDNYGMAIALGWLNDYLPSVDGVSDRVIILEIRPYGNTFGSGSVLTKEEFRDSLRGSGRSIPIWPLQEWTTPLEGGESARRAGMIGRNNLNRDLFIDRQKEKTQRAEDYPLLKWALAGKEGVHKPVTLATIRFKGNLDASLNWTLPKKEIEQVKAAADDIFLKDDAISEKYSLRQSDPLQAEAYQRWQHNNFQYLELRNELEKYFPLKKP